MEPWSARKRIDRFIRRRGWRVDIIDFKTDSPPAGPVEQTYPKYAAQVRIYGKLLETAGILKDRRLRCGLLFTADGSIRWLEP